ncbi:MAG: Gfo/Idh/MocA family oxidoreductase [Planctomycetales bacterium]
MTAEKVRWGILGVAKIAVEKVVPAMQKGTLSDITAIASRDLGKAQAAAKQLNLPKAYGSYEELLADPEIDAIYNPLPNHMHLEWTVKALEAGKHVLCEKPIGLNTAEAVAIADAGKKHPHLKLMEAFMYRFHPHWVATKELIAKGGIGQLRTIQSFFSYYNIDPANIRNRSDAGGGGLLDIGCYTISLSRFIFGGLPQRVVGTVEFDPQLQTDRLASAIMDFGRGTSAWTVSTQVVPYQRVNIFGDKGRIEIEIPFNAPTDRPCRMWHQTGTEIQEIVFPTADQYGLQGEKFSEAVLQNLPVPTPISDAVENMQVIDAVFRSGKSGQWEKPV